MKQNKKPKKKYTILKVTAVLAAIVVILGAASFPMKTVVYIVETSEVHSSVRIVQISDLHSCCYGKNMKNLINAVDEQQPDIIVLTGDIYDDKMDNKNTRTLLKYIGAKYPCYYAAGNHEFYSGHWSEYKAEAESFGITVLQGENVQYNDITICGAAQAADSSFDHEDSIKKCAETADGFAVLLDHFPENIDLSREYKCFDLVLSGHAHGGQWRIPFLLNGLISPGEGLFPKYAGGRYDFPDCTMIVSRGLSRENIPVPRIFNNPELVIIDIKPK